DRWMLPKLTGALAMLAFLLIAGVFAENQTLAEPALSRSFDGPDLTWELADPRPGVQLLAHGCVTEDAREGAASDRIVAAAPAGETVEFDCRVPHVPVLEEFESRLWVKSNRPGLALAVRVVLPRSIDKTTGLPRTALIQGKQYDQVGHWQQLNLADLPK